MFLFPYEQLTYQTTITQQEVLIRLGELIEFRRPRPWNIWWRKIDNAGLHILDDQAHKSYHGELKAASFRIRRISIWDSRMPTITGKLETTSEGCRIRVKMELAVYPIIGLVIVGHIAGYACLWSLLSLCSDEEFHPVLLLPFGIIVFVYCTTMISFKLDSRKTKRDLERVLEIKRIDK